MQTIETLQETPLSTRKMSEAALESPANSAANRAEEIRNEIRDEISSEIGQEESSGAQTDPQANLLAEQAAHPDVRMERVKAIQSALADGTYNVSASDVAAKLVTRLLKK